MLKLDDDTKLFEILVVLIIAIWVFGLVFFICDLGERITYHHDMFYRELERSEWNMLSTRLQRLYMMFLTDAQQSTYISCYGNVSCTRDTFKTVRILIFLI